ncbi:hypothetical protein LZC95_27205 [Pendulispora brunnea]|uniref:Uncharacterized protein n=1 Tax=Pendulispora brunnea TaxID=2905690 RepID=A0ABZ2JUJ0_9BACT
MDHIETPEPISPPKVKKTYESPRVEDLGNAVEKTKGVIGNVADMPGTFRTRGHGW